MRIRILPPTTKPPTQRIQRRHKPPKAQYPTYRGCLRWEFGFSCAFCLLHEADLARNGVEGLGVTGVEHFKTRHDAPEQSDDFSNCFYACRFCNGSRGSRPTEGSVGHLLNPCQVAWSETFEACGDELLSRPEDANAKYTEKLYDLNEPRKIALRKVRRETISECLAVLENGYENMNYLLALRTEKAEKAAETLLSCIKKAKRDLSGYRAVPQDHPEPCGCGKSEACSLPAWLAEQTLLASLESSD